MKKFITALFCIQVLFCNPSSAGVVEVIAPNPLTAVILVAKLLTIDLDPTYYVRVESSGRTDSEARKEAFKAAVEYAVGATVVSSTSVDLAKQRVNRSELLSYSAGYVNDFKVVSQSIENGAVTLVVDVWIKKSKIADRLLGESKTNGVIEGQRIQAQQESLQNERRAGDQVLQTVLSDYPTKSFVVKTSPTKSYFDDNRNLILEIPYTVSWDQNYLEALFEVLSKTAVATLGQCSQFASEQCRSYRGIVSIKMRPGNKGWEKTFAYNDIRQFSLIKNHLYRARTSALVTINDSTGHVRYQKCHNFATYNSTDQLILPSERLVQGTEEMVLMNGFLTMEPSVRLIFSGQNVQPTDLNQVNINIVNVADCPK